MQNYERPGWVLLCGDFNAGTNSISDFIESEESEKFLALSDDYILDQHLAERVTKDAGPLNIRGTALIEFCISSGIRILNGRVDKDNSSNFTYFAHSGCSTVDYVLSRQENFGMINKLNVGELCELSDHSPIEVSINCSDLINNHHPRSDEPLNWSNSFNNELFKNYNKQVYVKDESVLENLSSAMLDKEIIDFLNIFFTQIR